MGMARVVTIPEGLGPLVARKDICCAFSFVFSFPRGTYLGPRAHWHSKLCLRRAFPSKSSVYQ